MNPFHGNVISTFLSLAVFAAGTAPAEAEHFDPQPIAPGVYAVIGDTGQASPKNAGHTSNQGFIVADRGVIVIDSGGSDAQGQKILNAIRRVTSKSVLLLINTHAGPDHVLGNSAFRRANIPILGHREADRLMAERCSICLKNLTAVLGRQRMAGTEVARPDELIDKTTTLSVGGRVLDVLYFGQAHAPGDIAVFDRKSGVLFAGDLAYVDRLPELRDASIRNWIRALEKLHRLPLSRFVPGHGPVSSPGRLSESLTYLDGLLARVGMSYRKGESLAEASETVALPSFRGWALYDTLHPANVHYVYLELERQELENQR